MPFPKIWLLRHGQTHWNAEHRIQGQLESSLTPLGIAQARCQAELMRPVLRPGLPCFVSPLGRAQQTADIALGGAPFETDPRLAEAYAGAFQGMTLAEVAEQYPEIHASNPQNLDLFCNAPGGEGYESFHARILAFMRALDGPAVVVAHGLLGQVMRGIACGLTRAQMAALPNGQGCVYVLEDGQETVLA